MNAIYRSISTAARGEYKEKGSKFEAYAFPVDNVLDVHNHLDELRKIHHKARHHCFAYTLIQEGQTRAFDDGEPRHSAGDPILGQIRSYDLKGVLVVVVRYFGGTKLGISGLVNAYKEAAKQSLEAAKIIEIELSEQIIVTFSYTDINQIMRLIKEMKLTVVERKLGMNCELRLKVPNSKQEAFKNRIASLPAVKMLKGIQ